MTKKALRQLMENMEQCGYKAHLASADPLFLVVEKDGETVGTIGDKGVRVYDDFLEEKARLQNLLAYSETFENHAENSHGHKELARLSGYTLAAGLDTGTGTPTWYIYPDDATDLQVRTATGFKDLGAAKKVFAADAGLTSSPYGTDYQELFKSTFAELLDKHGYRIQASKSHDNVFDVTLKGKVVGSLAEDMTFRPCSYPRVNDNLNSLYQQSRWETDSEMYGSSVFTKRASDALLRLGYNIRHSLQELSLRFTVHRNLEPVATVYDNESASIAPSATPEQSAQVQAAVAKAREEMRQEFSVMLKLLQQQKSQTLENPAQSLSETMHHVIPQQADRQSHPPDESAPPPPSDENAPPPEEEDRGTGAVSCDITRTEAALMVALLGSRTGQKLAEKYNVRQLVDTLESKLRSPYPDIPAPGRTSRDMAENAPQAEQEGEDMEQ